MEMVSTQHVWRRGAEMSLRWNEEARRTRYLMTKRRCKVGRPCPLPNSNLCTE